MIVFLPFLRDTKKASGSRSEKRYSQRKLCCGGLPQGNFQGNGNVECLGHGREGKSKIVSNGGKRSLKRARRVTRLQEVQQTNELWSHTPLTRYETMRKLCKVSQFHLCPLENEDNYSFIPIYLLYRLVEFKN